MLGVSIHSENREVRERLRAVFGCSKEKCLQIGREAVSARADITEDDPASAEGLLVYIHGARNIRGLFRPKGWLTYRHENIEGVRHPERDLKIIHQNVDVAAAMKGPQPVSRKGPGCERLIDDGAAMLFTEKELR